MICDSSTQKKTEQYSFQFKFQSQSQFSERFNGQCNVGEVTNVPVVSKTFDDFGEMAEQNVK